MGHHLSWFIGLDSCKNVCAQTSRETAGDGLGNHVFHCLYPQWMIFYFCVDKKQSILRVQLWGVRQFQLQTVFDDLLIEWSANHMPVADENLLAAQTVFNVSNSFWKGVESDALKTGSLIQTCILTSRRCIVLANSATICPITVKEKVNAIIKCTQKQWAHWADYLSLEWTMSPDSDSFEENSSASVQESLNFTFVFFRVWQTGSFRWILPLLKESTVKSVSSFCSQW